MRALGLMSGTSFDGLDVACVDISYQKGVPSLKLEAFHTFPLPERFKKDLLEVSGHGPTATARICKLNFALGDFFSDAVLQFLKTFRISSKSIDVVGSHGQTVWHEPPQGKKFGSTLQIGEPSFIEAKTGITTVADFRPMDMAHGGQGAPLAPYLHYALFHQSNIHVGVQNIGGIGNLTLLKKGGSLSQVTAFDTGPGNVLIDTLVYLMTKGKHPFDKDGKWAKQGKVDGRVLNKLLSHPFLRQRPPKSTGRELFGCSFASDLLRRYKHLKKEDLLATVTAFTAHSIATHVEKFIFPVCKIQDLVIGGGGAKNKTLFYMIQHLLPQVQCKRFEDYHLNGDAIEAMAFALLATETIQGRKIFMPNVTGAKKPHRLGKIIPGDNFKSFSLK